MGKGPVRVSLEGAVLRPQEISFREPSGYSGQQWRNGCFTSLSQTPRRRSNRGSAGEMETGMVLCVHPPQQLQGTNKEYLDLQ